MNKSPLVSVILASFNHEAFVGQAIQSILDQTVTDWELIIVDDGSSDGSVAVIEGFDDPRIRFFPSEKNEGQFTALNRCLSYAAGEFVVVMNSDDSFLPDKLMIQLEFLRDRTDVVAVFSDVEFIDENGEQFTDSSHPYLSRFSQENRSRFEWLNHLFYHGNALCHTTVMVRRSAHDRLGGYNTRLAQIADMDFWIRLLECDEIYVLPQKLTRFRIHADEANVSGDSILSRQRLYWELTRVLSLYLEISSPDLFRKIFPESDLPPECPVELLPYYLARLALSVNSSIFRTVALDALYKLLADSRKTKLLADVSGFTTADFLRLSGQFDVFGRLDAERLEAAVTDRDSELEQINNYAAELNRVIDNQKEEIIKVENHADNLMSTLKAKEEHVSEIEGHLRAVENEMKALQETLSWKITKPLRKVSGWLHRLVRSRK